MLLRVGRSVQRAAQVVGRQQVRSMAVMGNSPAEFPEPDVTDESGEFGDGRGTQLSRPGDGHRSQGIPEQYQSRKIFIKQPSKRASQSGVGNTLTWEIEFDK